MHPDDLFAAIDAGAMITGTDKNYKIYVDAPSPDLGQRVDNDNAHLMARDCKFYFYHFDEAHMVRFIELYNTKKLNLEPMFGLYRMPFFMRPKTENDK
jgi:hypothetical protein